MTATVTRLALADIRPGANDRTVFDPDALAALAQSIAETGLAQPITVRPSGAVYEIVAGERRFRAHELLGEDGIDAIVRCYDDETASRIMLAENLHRDDLDPLDEAAAYRRRMDEFGLTVGEVATMAGVTTARVTTRLPLLRLVPEAADLVRAGALSINHARIMADLDVNRQCLALAALAKGLDYFAFRDVCVRLAEEQATEPLFDTDDFLRVEEYVADARELRKGPKTLIAGLLALIGASLGESELTASELAVVADAGAYLERTAR